MGTGTGFRAGIAAGLGHNVSAIDLSEGTLTDRALANRCQPRAPGGRVVAFYGVSPPQEAELVGASDEPRLFERHYTAETRAARPAMRLSSHDPLLQAASNAGVERASTTAIDNLRG